MDYPGGGLPALWRFCIFEPKGIPPTLKTESPGDPVLILLANPVLSEPVAPVSITDIRDIVRSLAVEILKNEPLNHKTSVLPNLFFKRNLHLLPHLPNHNLAQKTELVVKVHAKAIILCGGIFEPPAWSEEGLRDGLEFVGGGEDRNLTKVNVVVIVSTSRTIE